MQELLLDSEVELVLNLTRPNDHYEVTRTALLAGKHVYSEKPLATDLDQGRELVKLACERGLRLGGAPDTFMGSGIRTCKKLIEDGWIGKPVGGMCTMLCHGPESWHPAPEFFYKIGAGPLYDMGPYYITSLVWLLGNVTSVSAVCTKGQKERIITSEMHYGEKIVVEVDTHSCGLLQFESGATVTVMTSFDVHCSPQNQSRFEIYGDQGTLLVPDPNTFGGPVLMYRPEDQAKVSSVDPGSLQASKSPLGFKEIPLMFDYSENSRGLGLADMCRAIEANRTGCANSSLQLHVLEVMNAFEVSSRTHKVCPIESRI